MGPRRSLALLALVLSVTSCRGGSEPTVAVATASASPATSAPTGAPSTAVATPGSSAAAAVSPTPAAVVPTATPYQAQTSKGCTVSAGRPPYEDTGDFVRVPITGTCLHMRAPDTGEIGIKVGGKPHGETNDVPRFDENGYFSARPFVTQDGNVCGRAVTITVTGKYDFNANLSDTGSTTFTLVCG
jgi:hypothetical protein